MRKIPLRVVRMVRNCCQLERYSYSTAFLFYGGLLEVGALFDCKIVEFARQDDLGPGHQVEETHRQQQREGCLAQQQDLGGILSLEHLQFAVMRAKPPFGFGIGSKMKNTGQHPPATGEAGPRCTRCTPGAALSSGGAR